MKKGWLGFYFMFVLYATSFGQPRTEFRAAWVASVENIDWPSRRGLSTDSQRAEFVRLLDMHKHNGLNAVVVQIRPAADALYPSSYEPWSEWLSGTQGKAPSPYYDPLEFMIEETHKRGMEFHAWCNPYRAIYSIAKSSVSPSHITRTHPEWFLSYGGTRYFDPGNKEVQQWVVQVIRDIVHRYPIDGIHFDDYFYPYRIPGKEFPDDASFTKYGNGMSKEDWRRSNVDSIIVQLGQVIKEEKKNCKFGISPFGIWRNIARDTAGSNTQAGQTNYDDLYADILLWLKMGWIDYVVPQLYWEFGFRHAPYEVLLDWWANHTYGRQCYVGLGIFKAGSTPPWRDKTLLPREIQAYRNYPQVQGAVYFSSSSFATNPYGWNDSLRQHYYSYPALIPPMPWIDSVKPHQPVMRNELSGKDSILTVWLGKGSADDELRGFAIYRSATPALNMDSALVFQFIPYDPVAVFAIKDYPPAKGVFYFVTSVSANNVESDPLRLFNW